jgi:hypothetical protein
LVVLTANVSDFDILLQIIPAGRRCSIAGNEAVELGRRRRLSIAGEEEPIAAGLSR